jgi:hypothetical protein
MCLGKICQPAKSIGRQLARQEENRKFALHARVTFSTMNHQSDCASAQWAVLVIIQLANGWLSIIKKLSKAKVFEPVELRTGLPEYFQPRHPVLLSEINILTPIAARSHVIDTAR